MVMTMRGSIATAALVAAFLLVLSGLAKAQDGHGHPPQDLETHHSFYWYLTRPDIPDAQPGTCCGDGDCYPTPARFRDGQWQALRREDQVWVTIPESRVVTKQDQLARRPNSQATLCATPYFLYCFVAPETGI